MSDRRADENRWICPRCGYDLSNPAGPRCPECGGPRASAVPAAWMREKFGLSASVLNLWHAVLIGTVVILFWSSSGPVMLVSPAFWASAVFYLALSASLHIAGFYLHRWAVLTASATQLLLAGALLTVAIVEAAGGPAIFIGALAGFHACCACILAETFLKLRRSSAGD